MKYRSLVNKIIMSLTGLFLCFFLIIHLLGNSQLFLPVEQAHKQFNYYSELLSNNLFIKSVSYLLYLSILAHIFYALIISLKNRKSAGYFKKVQRTKTRWYRNNMGILGSLIFIFLIIHFKDFWYVYKFGSIGIDSWGRKDLYQVVTNAYSNIWYVVLYVLSMIPLGYHLLHGFFSACRTLGIYHPKYVKWLYYFGFLFSISISLGFAIIPVYIYLTHS